MSSYSPPAVHVTLTAETLVPASHLCGTTGTSLRSMAWLQRAAALRPDRIAVEAPDGRLTYAELYAAATEAARGAGGRVEIEARPGLDFVVRLHACLLAGARAVPVDSRLGQTEGARLRGAGGGPGVP